MCWSERSPMHQCLKPRPQLLDCINERLNALSHSFFNEGCTSGGNEEWGSGSSLENFLHVLEESLGECRNSRRTVILIVPAHRTNDLIRDVDGTRNKEVVSSWSIDVVHVPFFRNSQIGVLRFCKAYAAICFWWEQLNSDLIEGKNYAVLKFLYYVKCLACS